MHVLGWIEAVERDLDHAQMKTLPERLECRQPPHMSQVQSTQGEADMLWFIGSIAVLNRPGIAGGSTL